MKAISVLCLTIVALFTPFVASHTIQDELRDFCEIMPTDQMKMIAEEHLKADKEFNQAIIYLQSPAWHNLVREVQENTEWKNLKNKLIESGLNMDAMLNSFFGMVINLKPTPNKIETSRSLRAFFDDIEMVLPIGKILAMLHSKKQNSTVFRDFYNKISSEDVHKMFESVRKQPEIKRLVNELKSMGAKVDDIVGLFYGFMNWNTPSSISRREIDKVSLGKDLEDFKKLIPWEKLRNISDEHLINDEGFAEALKYFQSPEYVRIISAIKIRPEYIALKTYLRESGIDVEDIINLLLNIVHTKHGCEGNHTSVLGKTTNFRTYLDEIEATIPVDKLLALYNDKMENSETFKEFIKKMSDPKLKKMIDDVRALKESQELFEKLQELGIKMEEVFRMIYASLGWGFPI